MRLASKVSAGNNDKHTRQGACGGLQVLRAEGEKMTDIEIIKRCLNHGTCIDQNDLFSISEAATRMSERIEELERENTEFKGQGKIACELFDEIQKLKAELTAANPTTCSECAKRTKGCTSRMYFETRTVKMEYQIVDFCSAAVRKEVPDANNSDK